MNNKSSIVNESQPDRKVNRQKSKSQDLHADFVDWLLAIDMVST